MCRCLLLNDVPADTKVSGNNRDKRRGYSTNGCFKLTTEVAEASPFLIEQTEQLT